MTRCPVLIAHEAPEWDDATEEVQQGYYRDHEAFSAYVEAHGGCRISIIRPQQRRCSRWPTRSRSDRRS